MSFGVHYDFSLCTLSEEEEEEDGEEKRERERRGDNYNPFCMLSKCAVEKVSSTTFFLIVSLSSVYVSTRSLFHTSPVCNVCSLCFFSFVTLSRQSLSLK
jgi:hypothetical protein